MATRRNRGQPLDAWPGYVDALSTLLMVIIFVLLVFVLAQGFLSVALSGRDRALDRLNRQVAELAERLGLERDSAIELRASVGQLTDELRAAATARDSLSQRLAALAAERDRFAADRGTAERERASATARLQDLDASLNAERTRAARLEAQLAELLSTRDAAQRQLDASRADAAARTRDFEATARDLAAARTALEAERAQLARMQAEAAALNREVTIGRDTLQTRLAELAELGRQTEALRALRDQLETQARAAAARATTEEERRRAAETLLSEERTLGESARAQVALLNRQITELRSQIARIEAGLTQAETAGRDKDAEIAGLSQRLNLALAARVEELQRFRSDFFGRLRDVLGNRPGIQIVGDRFVFQAEVLFPTGSSELNPAGLDQLRNLARVITDISTRIPPDLPWILRVDGHADSTPIRSGSAGNFNWELSAQRAINVVKLLIDEGVPPNRLAATGFGEFQPIDRTDGPDARARNRRIELRLTDR